MATKTSLIIEMTSGEEIKSRSVSYVNPQASSAELVQFGQTYASLTNDTYYQTIKIDRTECDNRQALNVVFYRNDVDYESGSTVTLHTSDFSASNIVQLAYKCVPASIDYAPARPVIHSDDLSLSVAQISVFSGGSMRFDIKTVEKKTGTFTLDVHMISTNPALDDFLGSWTFVVEEAE